MKQPINPVNNSNMEDSLSAFEKSPLKYIAKNFGILTGVITICSYMFERSYLETLKIENVCPPLSLVDYFNNTMIWFPFLFGPLFLAMFIFAVIMFIKMGAGELGRKATVVKYLLYSTFLLISIWLSVIYINKPLHDTSDVPWGLAGLCTFALMLLSKIRNSEIKNKIYLSFFGLFLCIMLFGLFGKLAANDDITKTKNIAYVTMKYSQKAVYCNVLRVYDKFSVINFPPSKQLQIIRTDEMAVVERMR